MIVQCLLTKNECSFYTYHQIQCSHRKETQEKLSWCWILPYVTKPAVRNVNIFIFFRGLIRHVMSLDWYWPLMHDLKKERATEMERSVGLEKLKKAPHKLSNVYEASVLIYSYFSLQVSVYFRNSFWNFTLSKGPQSV